MRLFIFKKIHFALIFLAIFYPRSAMGSDVKDTLRSLLGQVIQQTGEKVIDNIQNRQRRTTSARPTSGRATRGGANDQWCHVWNNGRLIDHQACSASRKCKPSGTCFDTFVWPSGAKTVKEVRGRKTVKINGARSKTVRVHSDLVCDLNTRSGNVFCNTAGSYADLLQAPQPAVKRKRVATRTAPETPKSSSYDRLVDRYLTSVDKGGSTAAQSRCEMATSLITDHEDNVTTDLLDLLTTQMEIDGCLG